MLYYSNWFKPNPVCAPFLICIVPQELVRKGSLGEEKEYIDPKSYDLHSQGLIEVEHLGMSDQGRDSLLKTEDEENLSHIDK